MRIGIIGAGKVGPALAAVLEKKGFVIAAVADKELSSLKNAQKYIAGDTLYSRDNMDVVTASDVIAITTQDRIIREVVEEICEKADRLDGKLIFHTSGADSSAVLTPLNQKNAMVGSLHPLQTFPDIESAIGVLPDTCIFIEGDEKAIPLLRKLGETIGAKVYAINGEHKVLYHLSAVFVCNLLSALMYAGKGLMDKINIDFDPFLPIIEATIKNIERKGPLAALTGPVVRGDVKTVKAHLASIGDMELHTKVYKALSEVAVKMSEERNAIDEETAGMLRKILG